MTIEFITVVALVLIYIAIYMLLIPVGKRMHYIMLRTVFKSKRINPYSALYWIIYTVVNIIVALVGMIIIFNLVKYTAEVWII